MLSNHTQFNILSEGASLSITITPSLSPLNSVASFQERGSRHLSSEFGGFYSKSFLCRRTENHLGVLKKRGLVNWYSHYEKRYGESSKN